MTILEILSLHIVILFVLFIDLYAVTGLGAEPYYSNFYSEQQQQEEYKIKAALDKLDHGPQFVPDWPSSDVKFGQVSGVAMDNSGNVVVFHRSSNVWDASTFTDRNVYSAIGDPPISEPTILVFNDTGELIDRWGENMFFMPHGITVDLRGNVWVTDVALHQVFKFSQKDRTKPEMLLGEKFVPGSDDRHFCKPAAVAVTAAGDFFVADGYCNTRIIKYAPDGTKILQWGRRWGESPYTFFVPHALALCSQERELCVADRERGRVACFGADDGIYRAQYRSWLLGDKIYAVSYTPHNGGLLYVVNGANANGIAHGFVLEYPSGKVIGSFSPREGLHRPHSLAATASGDVFVAEIGPNKVHKFRGLPSSVGPAVVGPSSRPQPRPARPKLAGDVSSAFPVGESPAVSAGAAAAGVGAAALLAVLALLAVRARGAGAGLPGGVTPAQRRWEYGGGSQFKLRRLLERRRFTRVHSDDSEDEPAPMLPPPQSEQIA